MRHRKIVSLPTSPI